ncbi:MAG: hypothetical protein VKI42_02635 [Synechococcaceae cyanobacterium]|nr:hypothetical protein [Synechococcaceae cyanobacterium]
MPPCRSATCRNRCTGLRQRRAQAPKHSLSQQALADLEAIAGGGPRERRRQLLDGIARRGPIAPALRADQVPEDLIRIDRERCWPWPVCSRPRRPCG